MTGAAGGSRQRGQGLLLRWLLTGHWRAQPGRTMAAIAAVAVGVALALGIHLVNHSALSAFRQAIATVNGEADLQIRARSGPLEEGWLDAMADIDGVVAVSAVLELTVQVISPAAGDAAPALPATQGAAPLPLELIAVDTLAAGAITPALVPTVESATGQDDSGTRLALFEADVIFLSDAARRLWPGERLRVRADGRERELRIAGRVPGAAAGQVLAIMDLGSAQWAFGAIGQLSRIDLKLQDGAAADAVARQIDARLPAALQRLTPDSDLQRMSNLSRAYRVNLDVLALVALLTGGFIVLAATSLAAVRQQPEMALLRVLGASPTLPARSLLAQSLVVGLAGGAVGVAGGVLLAWLLLGTVGGDLGGGYFGNGRTRLLLSPLTALAFGSLGLLTALAGGMLPAWAAQRQTMASWLKPGHEERSWSGLRLGRPASLLIVAGLLLIAAPAWHGLPIAAYLAIAAFLFAGVALVPLLVRGLLTPLARRGGRLSLAPAGYPVLWLAIQRLANRPASVAIALAGVVASFALTAAMLIMVTSFRDSVDAWLDQVLPADLYARAPVSLDADIDPASQAAIRALPGVREARFLRSLPIRVGADAAEVTLIARDLGAEPIERQLPLTGDAHAARHASSSGEPVQVWVSEAMVSRHGFTTGSRHALPIGARTIDVIVAGVWRDYARQTGAIVIDRADYQQLTGDHRVSDVALWLADGRHDPGAVIAAVRKSVPALADAEFRSAEALRSLSLAIFDRSFAVTYALEAIALVVGLFGVASTYAAEALNRAREFGMLRHLGLSRMMVVRQLGIEAALATTIAVGWGGLLGLAIGAVLILRVNPQSFHWTMDLTLPVGLLVAAGLALITTAVIAAGWSAREASGQSPVLAVRAEWS